jgi:hypothetical protein
MQRSHINFPNYTDFIDCVFHSEVHFQNVKFNEYAGFDGSVFFEITYFKRATFKSVASFRYAQFNGGLYCEGTQFCEWANFGGINFDCREATFENCIFEGGATFNESNFYEACFMNTKFEKSASFFESIFKRVPNFYGAQFKEYPHFDGFKILNYPNESYISKLEITSRWRSLRQLAAKSNDHEAELNFFAGELKSRQEPVMRGFAFCYGLFSDFGRAIFRPLAWLLLTAFLAFNFYIAKHSPLVFEKGIVFTKLTCKEGDKQNDPRTAALLLSLEKALPLISGKDEKAKQNMLCLYGGEKDAPYIPDSVSLVGTVQTLVSLIFLFLAGLGIRNRFRLK